MRQFGELLGLADLVLVYDGVEVFRQQILGLGLGMQVRLGLDELTLGPVITLPAMTDCLCGSLAQYALSLKRLSAGPGFNPQTWQNKLFQDYWRACFEINF